MDDKKKKIKKKGPFRTEAILPITIFIALLIAYFTYFFDGHLRRGLEFGATMANGAEVNISSLNMKWSQPGMSIVRIQVTNKDEPSKNLIEIGRIELRLLWDALLRGKFVIPESAIQGIELGSPRQKPGRVLPKKPGSSGGLVSDIKDEAVQELKNQNNANFLGDLIDIADGTNYKDKLKSLEGQLKSKEKVAILEKELKTKEQEWKKRIDGLPKESEIKQLVNRIKSFKFDSSNPKKIQESLKKLDQLHREAKTKYKSIENAKKTFDSDLKKYKGTYGSLEQMIKDDINGLAAKLNIPSLDPAELSKNLLGGMVADQLAKVNKYKNIAREYIPTKTEEAKNSQPLTPHERAKGRNFKFLRTNSYPRFWLQKAEVSSKASAGGNVGNLTGTITDVTDAPKHLGKPAKAHLEGGFPGSKIHDVVADILIDHTTDIAKESAKITVGHFPVQKNMFSESKDVQFGYNKADGQSKIAINLQEEQLSLKANSLFTNIDYLVQAQSSKTQEILKNVAAQLSKIDLNVRAKGSWDDISLHINSNLGQKLQQAIKNEVSAQVKKARQDVEKHVRGLIAKEKGKVDAELKKIEQKLGISLKSKDAALKSIDGEVKKKKDELKNKEKKKVEKKLKKEGKKLLDGLKKKFKF